MAHRSVLLELRKSAITSIFLLCVWNLVCGQIRYSIPEELGRGAFVGEIGKDLGLSIEDLASRKFRIVSVTSIQYLDVNRSNGNLCVNARIDREQLCGESDSCVLLLEAVVENPVEQYRVEVEILDINDNSPTFPKTEVRLEIPETAMPGAHFLLERAHDMDGRNNSIRTYQLNSNEHFSLDVQSTGKWKLPELVLETFLDRENQSGYSLLLTALDGGSPERSGTAQLIIVILDANDNAPAFHKSLYSVHLRENMPPNSLVINLHATDLDEGTNGEIVYTFSRNNDPVLTEIFIINPHSGEIRTKGILDFEQSNIYQIHVEAKDKSAHPLSSHCVVRVEIADVNDNSPDLKINFISGTISEDIPTGTLIALLSVTDRDSNQNGDIDCSIFPKLPFELKSPFSNSYRLVTSALLDRERAAQHIITVTCKDHGSPPLFCNRTIIVNVTDVNDNAPQFTQPSYTFYVTENNKRESYVGRVTTLDLDIDQNSQISYAILEQQIQSMPVSSYLYIHSTNGIIHSKISFDYEHLKTFQFRVRAQDSGLPSLSSDVTVHVIVLDQNDNTPTIISMGTKGNASLPVLRSAQPGYLITKIIASDADSGKNGLLFYNLKQATVPGLFIVSHNSGEIRSVRKFKVSDASIQKLTVQVKDNGYPSLSATTTLTLTVIDEDATYQPDLSEPRQDLKKTQQLSFYIVIILGTTSLILLVIIIVLVVVMCLMGSSAASINVCPFVLCCHTRKLKYPNANVKLQSARGSHLIPNIVEVRGNGSLSDTYRYKIRSAPEPAEVFFTPFDLQMAGTIGKDDRFTQQYNTKAIYSCSNVVSGVYKMEHENFTKLFLLEVRHYLV